MPHIEHPSLFERLLLGLDELDEEARQENPEQPDAEQDARTAGELLFAAANAMRLAGVDAEEALTFASGRFRQELLQKTEDSDGQERPATV